MFTEVLCTTELAGCSPCWTLLLQLQHLGFWDLQLSLWQLRWYAFLGFSTRVHVYSVITLALHCIGFDIGIGIGIGLPGIYRNIRAFGAWRMTVVVAWWWLCGLESTCCLTVVVRGGRIRTRWLQQCSVPLALYPRHTTGGNGENGEPTPGQSNCKETAEVVKIEAFGWFWFPATPVCSTTTGQFSQAHGVNRTQPRPK